MSLITRAIKGSSLSYAEMDGNLEYLEERINLLGTSGGGGTSGVAGTSGTSGTHGTSGVNGSSGTSGTRGTSGTSGIGISGTSGTSGVGTSGTSGTSPDFSSYTGSVDITGDLTLTGSLNSVLISRGGGDSGDNIAIGYDALKLNAWTSGDAGNYNTAIGSLSLASNETGLGNTAVGSGAMVFGLGSENTGIGFQAMFFGGLINNNTAIGSRALHFLGNSQSVAQTGNTALGTNAGRWITPNVSTVNQAADSIFIGYNSRPKANAQTNQIIIGTGTIGNGSNTTTLGTPNTTALYLGGRGGEGIVLTSPGGTKYKITVADDGTLTTTPV